MMLGLSRPPPPHSHLLSCVCVCVRVFTELYFTNLLRCERKKRASLFTKVRTNQMTPRSMQMSREPSLESTLYSADAHPH